MDRPDFTAIYGRGGEGKTSLAYHRARLKRSRIAVFDPSKKFPHGVVVDPGEDLEAIFEQYDTVVCRCDFDVEEIFDQFEDRVWEAGNLAFVVDESSLLQSPNYINRHLERMIRLGRHRDIVLFITQHSPRDSFRTMRSLPTSQVFFKLTDADDLKKVGEISSPEAAARVHELAPFCFLEWNPDASSYAVHTDPASWKISDERPRDDAEERETIAYGR
jgi:DNA helicase HerA-like ATPase